MGEQVAAGFKWGCSSVGRAPALQAGGHEFESHHLHETMSHARFMKEANIELARIGDYFMKLIRRMS